MPDILIGMEYGCSGMKFREVDLAKSIYQKACHNEPVYPD